VVVAAGSVVASVEAAAIEPRQVLLLPPAAPIYIGGYARVPVDLGTTGIVIEDLTFDIVEGPQFAGLSASRDDPFDPAHSQVMLLAGPHAGMYTLRARDSGGTQIATMPFQITDQWTDKDGPSQAFTGVNPLYASGGAWGSGVFPQNFTYGLDAITGPRRIALIFVNLSDATIPVGTDTLYINALINGVVGVDGVRRSVAHYYDELSDSRLPIVMAGTSTVTRPHAWGNVHYQRVLPGGGKIWQTEDTLIQSALLAAQHDIDFTGVDTAVFVIASPNGGLPDPANPGSPGRFCWPHAWGGTYILTEPPSAVRRGTAYWFKSLSYSAMPAEWETVDAGKRRVYETLSHEIGHTIGMWDLYVDSRRVGDYDLMDTDSGVPALSLPHQVMLGWVDPRHMRTYNFRIENPVLDTITLTAAELLGSNAPPVGEHAGAIVEVADGWRYYFEYRSRQNLTTTDAGPTQVADQNMPEDRQVVGLDVAAGWYHPPVQRTPIRRLVDDGDGQGAVLNVGEDYEEPDPTGNSIFRLQVISADDDRATVRVSYQPPPSPEPPWPNGPDPSIRPWPGGGDWRSPDLSVINFSGTNVNIPWAGHLNMIAARVTNSGNSDAKGVRVGFWVKDFTVSVDAPETLLGWATADIPAGSNYTFGMRWTPPAYSGASNNGFGSAHYCLVARIAPHAGEGNPNNNEAQTNYTVVWTASSSAFSRQRIPVQVANPYTDRIARVLLHAEQRQPWYRTYLEHKWLTLAPGEVRSVEAMFECIADQPEFGDDVPPAQLYGEPNFVTIVAAVFDSNSDAPAPIGGSTIEVRAARAAQFVDLDISRTSASGRVILATDGSPVPQRSTVALSGMGPNGQDITYQSRVGPNGSFAANTPDFAHLQQGSSVDVLYGGDLGIAPLAARVVLP
jgi:M6 family metalloprotease-like protein